MTSLRGGVKIDFMKKDNIKNIKDFLVYAFQIINGKTKKDTRMWSYISEEYEHYLDKTNIEGIAFAINYLKQFNYNEKSKDYAGHSKRFILNLCLERIAFLSIMENKKFQPIEVEVSKILKKIDIKNYTFTSQKIDNDKLKEMHKAKYS